MSESHVKDHRRIEAYRQELEADPKSLVFVALSEALNRVGEFDEAADVAQRGLRSHRDSVAGRLALAVAEAGRGNIRDALEQIKAALIIDTENPRALALMGSLLLQKGLARRAVQFLSQAVKLAPDTREYADLLRRATRLAKSESPVQLPVVRGENMPEPDSPWGEEDAGRTVDGTHPGGENEHTVFDPDAVRLGGVVARGARGRGSEAEVTHYAEPGAERTTFDTRQLMDTPPPSTSSAWRDRPKLGGSAAEYSRLTSAESEKTAAAAIHHEATVAAARDAFGFEDSEPDARAVSQDVPSSSLATVYDTAIAKKRRTSSSKPPIPQAPSVVQAAARQLADGAGAEPEPVSDRVDAALDPAEGPRADAKVSSRPVLVAAQNDAAGALKAEPAKTADSGASKPAKPSKAPKSGAEANGGAASGAPAKNTKPPPESNGAAGTKSAKASPESNGGAPAKSVAASPESSGGPARGSKAPKSGADSNGASRPPSKPELVSGGGKPATMFVDDAVWAIYGAERPAPSAAPRNDPAEAKPAAPARHDDKAAPAAAPRRRSVLVVRTSERFGQITRGIVITLLSAAALWAGYSAAVARSGAAPTDAREELKGVASDLERGGLASLLAAEEAVNDLLPVAPDLEPVLKGVLAEIHARIWSGFGRSPRMLELAKADLAAVAALDPSLEVLRARVLLSTSAAERSQIGKLLDKTMIVFPDSPKGWLLRADVAPSSGEALRALHRARDVHKKRRDTLLALARWHGRHGAHAAAFAAFDDLLSQTDYRDDVEAAIDRVVLGQISGRDPAGNQFEGRLAGLVREELPHVAKDEAGRVALAFAVAAFGRGDPTAIDQLARAEAAFEESAPFKTTVGDVLVAAGEWARARAQYERAAKLDPKNEAIRVGIARVSFGEQAELSRPDASELAAGAGAGAGSRSAGPGAVVLPFGVVRFVFGEFALVEVDESPRVFPEAAYTRAVKAAAAGGAAELDKLLEAENLLALAERKTKDGKAKNRGAPNAIKLLERARAIRPSAEVEIALGRAYVERRELDDARRAFEDAVRLDPSSASARYHLGQVLAEQGATMEAIAALEKIDAPDMISPDVFRLLASLRQQRGDDQGAFSLLERELRSNPADPELLVRMGRLQHERKRHEEALAFYRRALGASQELADLQPSRGAKSKRRVDMERTGVDFYYLGRVVLDVDDRQGIKLLMAATRFDDVPIEAHFHVGRELIKQKKTKKNGRRSLEIYVRGAPGGPFVAQAERLLRGR